MNYLTDYLESFPLDREMRLDSEDFQSIRARLGARQSVMEVMIAAQKGACANAKRLV